MSQETIFWYFLDGIMFSVTFLVTCYYYKKSFTLVYQLIMTELYQIYFCRHNFFLMVRDKFFPRFGEFNQEGFCYTASSVVMLGLKAFKKSRVVRGRVKDKDFSSLHSWVEVRLCGQWWVIDPCYLEDGIMRRYHYYRKFHPEVMIIYDYKTFWNDSAKIFRTRLEDPETSRIFLEIYWYYTPLGNDNVYIKGSDAERMPFLEDNRDYRLFPPEYDFRFSQEIVDDFMARPARKSPRRRSLRRLERFYKKKQRELAQNTPA